MFSLLLGINLFAQTSPDLVRAKKERETKQSFALRLSARTVRGVRYA